MSKTYRCEIKKQSPDEFISRVMVRSTLLPFEELIEGVIDRDVVKIEILSSSMNMYKLYMLLKQKQCCLVKNGKRQTIRQNSIVYRGNIVLFTVNEDIDV